MKSKRIFIFAPVITLVACMSTAHVAYEFPREMAEPVRSEFARACDKGKVLYQLNCARCHNVRKGKKEMIPDFTQHQIKGYEIRVTNAQHEENLPDEKVTAEELGLISTFLLYKKKSGVPLKN